MLQHFTTMLASACFSLQFKHFQVSVLAARIIIISTIIYDVPKASLWPLQSYPRCLQSIVFISFYKFMSCRAGEALFAPNTNPLCSKVTLTTCFESCVAALLMPGCFCRSPENFLLFHQHAEGQNYMSCFFKNTLFKSSSQQSYAKFTNPQHRIFPFLSFYRSCTDFFPFNPETCDY